MTASSTFNGAREIVDVEQERLLEQQRKFHDATNKVTTLLEKVNIQSCLPKKKKEKNPTNVDEDDEEDDDGRHGKANDTFALIR